MKTKSKKKSPKRNSKSPNKARKSEDVEIQINQLKQSLKRQITSDAAHQLLLQQTIAQQSQQIEQLTFKSLENKWENEKLQNDVADLRTDIFKNEQSVQLTNSLLDDSLQTVELPYIGISPRKNSLGPWDRESSTADDSLNLGKDKKITRKLKQPKKVRLRKKAVSQSVDLNIQEALQTSGSISLSGSTSLGEMPKPQKRALHPGMQGFRSPGRFQCTDQRLQNLYQNHVRTKSN